MFEKSASFSLQDALESAVSRLESFDAVFWPVFAWVSVSLSLQDALESGVSRSGLFEAVFWFFLPGKCDAYFSSFISLVPSEFQ